MYGDTDVLVAADVDDAWAALVEHNGGTREDFDDGDMDMEEMPSDQLLTIWCNAAGEPDEPHVDGNAKVTKTAAEWAASQPRGFLSSSEY